MDIRKTSGFPQPSGKYIKSSPKTLPVILFAVMFLVIGTVFASTNITLNGGQPIQLGGGVVAVSACDPNIKFNLDRQVKLDDPINLKYEINKFTISDIATGYTDDAGYHPECNGTVFQLNFYHKKTIGYDILTCAQIGYGVNTDLTASITPSPDSATCINSPENGTLFFKVTSAAGNPAQYEFSDLHLDPDLADSIAIMSVKHDFPYLLGGRGPGGGTIFFVSDDPFTSDGSDCASNCHYLEFAPVDWHDVGVRTETTKSGWVTGVGPDCWTFDTGQSTTPLTSNNESGLTGEALNWRIGSGMANTRSMQRAIDSTSPVCTGGISDLALSFEGNDRSKGQWFVPSVNEMNELCKYANYQTTGVRSQKCIGATSGVLGFDHGVPVTDNPYVNLDSHSYWTSSASTSSSGAIFTVLRGGGDGGDHFRGANSFVRPIRAF